jgi:ectoine hydroxylase-related dioxygenase (phytanoyl-CoA dioxygenase family)
MSEDNYKEELYQKGYCIIPNVLDENEIKIASDLFRTWQSKIPAHDKIHDKIDHHGIYKFYQAGHQRHAWYIRTNPKVQEIFKTIWETDDLVVSFDGSCYISKECSKKDNIWTHTDQAPKNSDKTCVQGFVSLTSNCERTLVVYEGSHLTHAEYFNERNNTSSKNWNLIDHDWLENNKTNKRLLAVPAGSLVLWDSRTFHQNQYGAPRSEERIVQYVCFLPKNNKKNTPKMNEKRVKYLHALRTTSHWPYPISVNGLQPQTFGDTSLMIDYDNLEEPYISDMINEIYKII